MHHSLMGNGITTHPGHWASTLWLHCQQHSSEIRNNLIMLYLPITKCTLFIQNITWNINSASWIDFSSISVFFYYNKDILWPSQMITLNERLKRPFLPPLPPLVLFCFFISAMSLLLPHLPFLTYPLAATAVSHSCAPTDSNSLLTSYSALGTPCMSWPPQLSLLHYVSILVSLQMTHPVFDFYLLFDFFACLIWPPSCCLL